MRLITLWGIIGCFALTGCGEPAAPPDSDSGSRSEADVAPTGREYSRGGAGSGGFGGDPRAGRKDRPQRPELEE